MKFPTPDLLPTPWYKRPLFVRSFLGVVIALFLGWSLLGLSAAVGRLVLLEFLLSLTPSQSVNGVRVLAFGIDDTRAVKRSDTLILFHLDTAANQISALSIPRDTRVAIPGHGMNKINHAYAYGGADLLVKSVSDFVNYPIDAYVQINLQGVEQLIDALGGLSLMVEKDLYYVDRAGGLTIDIQEGEQLLSGEQAIQYLRFRQDDEGDIGRIRRQQHFLERFADKAKQMGTLLELPGLIKALNNTLKTDLSMSEMIGMAMSFKQIYENGEIQKGTVPGAIRLMGGVSFWKPDLVETNALVQRLFASAPIAAVAQNETFTVIDVEQAESPIVADSPSAISMVITDAQPTPSPMNATAFVTAVAEAKPIEAPDTSTLETPAPAPAPTKEAKPKASKIAQTQPKPTATKPSPETPERRQVTYQEVTQITQQQDPEVDVQFLLSNDVTIEVLNGIGVGGAAQTAAAKLKKLGLKVTRFDNAGSFEYQQTLIVDWKGRVEHSLALAQSLGIDPANIIVYDRPEKPLDFTLVLGADWKNLFLEDKQIDQ